MFPRVLFVQQGDAKLGEVLIYIIFRNESSRDVRTGKETRKLVGVELSV